MQRFNKMTTALLSAELVQRPCRHQLHRHGHLHSRRMYSTYLLHFTSSYQTKGATGFEPPDGAIANVWIQAAQDWQSHCTRKRTDGTQLKNRGGHGSDAQHLHRQVHVAQTHRNPHRLVAGLVHPQVGCNKERVCRADQAGRKRYGRRFVQHSAVVQRSMRRQSSYRPRSWRAPWPSQLPCCAL